MAKSHTKSTRASGSRSPSTGRRPPARRRPVWPIVLAALAVIALVAIVLAAGSGNDDDKASGVGGFIGGDLHSVVAMPDGRVYVGGHDGVTVTTDSGHTWRQVDTLAHADAMGWGTDGRTVFVSGHPGLNRSDDDGATFRRTNDGLPDTDVHSFGAGAAVLYAAGPGIGVAASTDDGKTWEQRSTESGRSFFGRILVDPADADHVVAADAQGGPVASNDGGRSWQTLGGLPAATWISSPDASLETLVASGPAGAARSRDGGRTWEPLRLPAEAQLVEAAPGDGQHLFAAGLADTKARLWSSTDGGSTWSAA